MVVANTRTRAWFWDSELALGGRGESRMRRRLASSVGDVDVKCWARIVAGKGRVVLIAM